MENQELRQSKRRQMNYRFGIAGEPNIAVSTSHNARSSLAGSSRWIEGFIRSLSRLLKSQAMQCLIAETRTVGRQSDSLRPFIQHRVCPRHDLNRRTALRICPLSAGGESGARQVDYRTDTGRLLRRPADEFRTGGLMLHANSIC